MYNVTVFVGGAQMFLVGISLHEVEHIKTGMMEGKMICIKDHNGPGTFYINGARVGGLTVLERIQENKQL